MAINCCKDCKDRYRGCHSTCKTYITAAKIHNEEKERLRKEKMYTHDDRLRVIHGIRATMRKRNNIS